MQHLHRIHQLTNAVARSDTIEMIYEEALNALAQSLKTDRAAVLLFDARRTHAFQGLARPFGGISQGGRGAFPLACGRPGILSPSPSPVSRPTRTWGSLKEHIWPEGISALAFIPLVCRDRLLGKFMIYYDSIHEFTLEEIQMAQTIASQIAFAVERTTSRGGSQALSRDLCQDYGRD